MVNTNLRRNSDRQEHLSKHYGGINTRTKKRHGQNNTHPDPPTFLFMAGKGPYMSPLTGSKIGHSPSSHVTGVRTVSRPMGYVINSGPERVERATPHLTRKIREWTIKGPMMLTNFRNYLETNPHAQPSELHIGLRVSFTYEIDRNISYSIESCWRWSE